MVAGKMSTPLGRVRGLGRGQNPAPSISGASA